VQLSRSIGIVRATAMVVGIIVGASIFVQPSEIVRLVPSSRDVLVVWLIAGVLTLFGALVCAELASAFPRSGGVYVFLKEAWSPAAGFLWGWAMFWVMHSGIVAAIAVIIGRYSGGNVTVVAIAAILLLSAINYVGVRQGSALQTFFTIVKIAALVVLLATMEHRLQPVGLHRLKPVLHDILLAVSAALFAYGGWHMVTYSAEETRDPERTIPRALIIGIAIVTGCYVWVNVATRGMPLMAKPGSTLNLLVILSALGALAGVILAGPRVYYAMAQDGLLFRWAGAIHPRFRTPHRAIVMQAIWPSVLVATGTYRSLFTRVVYTEWIFFAAMAAGVFVLRRRSDYAPRVRVPALVPLLFVVASLAIVANQIAAEPVQSAVGLLIVIAGLPVYFLWSHYGHRFS